MIVLLLALLALESATAAAVTGSLAAATAGLVLFAAFLAALAWQAPPGCRCGCWCHHDRNPYAPAAGPCPNLADRGDVCHPCELGCAEWRLLFRD